MTGLPGSPKTRRRFAFLFLALGGVLLARSVSSDWPHEQRLIYRLEGELAESPLKLDTSVTRVGESEARGGMSLERDGSERTSPAQTLRLPNGEYVVTVVWELRKNAVPQLSREPKEGETSSVHRVTLEGGEVVVRVRSRVNE